MKKITVIILCIAILLSLIGCKASKIDNSSKPEKIFSQSIRIAKKVPPRKSKTTTDVSTINEVLNVLSQIQKEKEITERKKGGTIYGIYLDVDGNQISYAVGGIFNDADGKQYEISNSDEIKEKLEQIYQKIDAPEVDFP